MKRLLVDIASGLALVGLIASLSAFLVVLAAMMDKL